MKTQQCKLKILGVGPVQTSSTVKVTTRKVVLKVVDVPVDNAFGHNKENTNDFEVEVYNHNIENFNITTDLIGETAICELVINFYKGNDGPAVPRFIVNDLSFRL